MGDQKGMFSFALKTVSSPMGDDSDGILYVHWPDAAPTQTRIADVLTSALKTDPELSEEVAVLALPGEPNKKIVLAPTGPIDPDYDDVRSLRDAAHKGVKRALKSGLRNILLVLEDHPKFKNAALVTLLGTLEAAHVPIQIRELKPSNLPALTSLQIFHPDATEAQRLLDLALALEAGRKVARDIGDADPERMAPPKVQEYVEGVFKGSSIKITTIADEAKLTKEYPLFAAVNRAASVVDRHKGRIMFLEYEPNSVGVKDTVMLVGKGVTYDTGGADIKAGGIMAGMSRDKCGAAAVAGFMKVVDALQPKDVKVVAALSLVRNSVGSNGYVADELIKSRSGALVRIGNTDAEGRMIMADVLCHMKELALNAVNPHLFTVATLTGHAHLTVGVGYSIVMDNGPAKASNFSNLIQSRGEVLGDPFEISTIRREDMAFHKGKSEGDDVMQCNNLPSSKTARGHQGPGAFLILASGLDKHGSQNDKPLKYSHLDIAGSGGDFPDPATGAPILALANTFLMNA